MSQIDEFDFWEFVCCAKCRLSFVSESGVTVPFWLTECGHVVCNNHLQSNQSCVACGAQGIQLVPLQREMDTPMSEWFKPAPYALDTISYAIKFQQESMAAQIRFYKARHQQQRMFIDKLRHENMLLKRNNGMITNGSGYAYDQQEPSDTLNGHGKRRMQDLQRPMTTSSPRSIEAPIGPNRLTLPPGQHPPYLTSRPSEGPEDGTHQSKTHGRSQAQSVDRPGTSRFNQKFAYTEPPSNYIHSQHLSHEQGLTRNFERTRQPQELQNQIPPTSRPAKPQQILPSGTFKPPNTLPNKGMAPPPPPQRKSAALGPNRFLPPEERFAPPTTLPGNGPNHNPLAQHASQNPRHAERAPSRQASAGRQRMPFVPGGHNDFG